MSGVRPEVLRRFEIERGDPGYPSLFDEVSDPPKRLYGIGDPTLLAGGLGVIGARRATPYGRRCARLFARWAGEHGVCVVSGAAVGCDQEAHRAALEAGGTTVAVLGCGADVDYPRGASALLDTIRSRGLVISEVPWGTQPKPYLFPRRNRLIAALSHVLIVVEASLPSGTFTTADFALAAGREVLAVPGSIFSPECLGANRLIRQGATPLTDVSELAQAFGTTHAPTDAPVVERHRDRLARALVANPMRPDDAARECGMDVVEVVRRVSELELQGIVRRYPDGRYGP